MDNKRPIMVPELCTHHRYRLVHSLKYAESDPWMALVVAANITMFQVMTADEGFQKESGGDIHHIEQLGCLACIKRKEFNQLIDELQSNLRGRHIGVIKAFGERFLEGGKTS